VKLAVLCIALSGLLLIGATSAPRDVQLFPECPICGMDRRQYSHSRMVIDYKEGPVGTCSIHCAGADLAVNRHKHVQGIAVADFGGKQLIPAQTAFWVIGGKRSGVMTQRAKWAFEKRADAEAFVRDYGGSRASFDDAVKATFEDMYTDIKAIRKRAQKHKVRASQSTEARELP